MTVEKTVKVQKVLWMEFHHNLNCALSDLQWTSTSVGGRKSKEMTKQKPKDKQKHRWDLVTSMTDDWFERSFWVKPWELGNELHIEQHQSTRPLLGGETLCHDITALILWWNMLDQHVVAAARNLTGGSGIHTMCRRKVTKLLGRTRRDDGYYGRIILQDS